MKLKRNKILEKYQGDVTALYDEGCAEVGSVQLVESWSRHMLTWLNRWQEDGNGPLHAEWMGLLRGVGEPIEEQGVFLGTDDETLVLTGRLVNLLGSRGGDWEILATSAFVSIAVPLVVFFAMQRFLGRGLLAGSVK